MGNATWWILWLLAGAALEVWGLRSGTDQWPTLTEIVRHAPKWTIAVALGWLAYHFDVAALLLRVLALPFRE